jgi:hypothetical protein
MTSTPQILAEVERYKDGHSPPPGEHWLRFPLEEHLYGDLLGQLRKANLWEYHEHKLRYVKSAHVLLLGSCSTAWLMFYCLAHVLLLGLYSTTWLT